MLIVPPLVTPEQRDRVAVISPYAEVSHVDSVAVECPLVGGRLIAEGCCYDFQAFAQGSGTREWQILTAQLYEATFQGSRTEMSQACIRHQLEIAKAGSYPAEYCDQLNARLGELTTSP